MNRLLTVLAASSCLVLPALADQPATKEAAKHPAEKTPAAPAPVDPIREMKKDDKKPAMPSMEEMAAMGNVGENHKLLEKMAGSWTTKAKFRMAPDQPWMESAGFCESKPYFGGRFLHTTYKGDMMGQEFNGMAIMGYDNIAKEFQSTWIDDMTTGTMNLAGSYDAASKTFTMSGQCSCPTTGGKKTTKEVIKLTSADSYTMDFYDLDEKGNEFVSMTIAYTRAAAPKADKSDKTTKETVKDAAKDAMKDLKDKLPGK